MKKMKKAISLIFLVALLTSNIYSENTYTADYKYIFTGSGDDVITITKYNEDLPDVLFISGNESERHFSIVSYDENGDYLKLLVNTTEKYVGVVSIDLPVGTITKSLEISAVGKWQILVFPIGSTEHIDIGEKKSYQGDNILWINEKASTAQIKGNNSSRYFSVVAYDIYGNYSKLLINTTDYYSGKVLLPKDTLLLEVNASGSWDIILN